ncbi:MAG: NAD-dependent deacylase [Terriglobia bacterium]
MAVSVSHKLKSLLVPSTRVVVFTGAGVSAESGVPTFRGKDGLWKEFNVQDLATPEAFARNPARVWEWYQWRMEIVSQAQPNDAHRVIAWMESFFSEFTLITQNVDGLHDRAGNRRICKLHGDLWDVRCLLCGKTERVTGLPPQPLPPVCGCGGMLRPGVVWFGEMLPELEFSKAEKAAMQCQLFFSVGTSMEVFPAARLPNLAREKGAYIVEINPEPTSLAGKADEVLIGKAGEILPLIQDSTTAFRTKRGNS